MKQIHAVTRQTWEISDDKKVKTLIFQQVWSYHLTKEGATERLTEVEKDPNLRLQQDENWIIKTYDIER